MVPNRDGLDRAHQAEHIKIERSDRWERCSRTSGGTIIRDTVATFFHLFPTPTAVVEAEAAAMMEAIRPLGMQENRIKALKRMSESFVQEVCFLLCLDCTGWLSVVMCAVL